MRLVDMLGFPDKEILQETVGYLFTKAKKMSRINKAQGKMFQDRGYAINDLFHKEIDFDIEELAWRLYSDFRPSHVPASKASEEWESNWHLRMEYKAKAIKLSRDKGFVVLKDREEAHAKE